MKNKDRPAILNVNIGTTVKGAVDDLDRVSCHYGLWEDRDTDCCIWRPGIEAVLVGPRGRRGMTC